MAIPPEKVAHVRARYAAGDSVAKILAETEMTLSTFYAALDGKLDDGGATKPEPIPRRSKKPARVKRARRARPATRAALVSRLWRAAERQVREIERRLGHDDREGADNEREARALAVLVKALRELHAFDVAQACGKTEPDANDDVRDLDEFRRELARKIDRLAAADPQAGDRES
jgi:hypothetical protein